MTEVAQQARVRFGTARAAQVVGEIDALMRAHWREVGHYDDIPLDPDFDRYAKLEQSGVLRIYTARAGEELVGYALYLLGTALHYKQVITAQQATLFLHPRYRAGLAGVRFLKFTESALKAEGVQIISQHVKMRRDFGPVLVRIGYELQDYVYTKRL